MGRKSSCEDRYNNQGREERVGTRRVSSKPVPHGESEQNEGGDGHDNGEENGVEYNGGGGGGDGNSWILGHGEGGVDRKKTAII